MIQTNNAVLILALVAAAPLMGCLGIFDDPYESGGTTPTWTGPADNNTSTYVSDDGGWCALPGDGPERWEPSWSVGTFPLEPILELYDETQCKTVSPSFLWDLFHEVAGMSSVEADVGDLTGAVVELSGFDAETLKVILALEPDADLEIELRSIFRLYLLSLLDEDVALVWNEWVAADSMRSFVVGYIPDFILAIADAWGVDALAETLAIEPEAIETCQSSGLFDGVYESVFGVTYDEAMLLFEQYGIGPDTSFGAFVSIDTVSRPVNGQRTAFLHVVDENLAPIRGLGPLDFEVLEEGVFVSKAITVDRLGDLARSEDSAPFALSLVLDYSGSMSDEDKRLLEEGLVHFFDVLPPVYRASVIKFSDDTVVYQPMTTDVDALRAAITSPMWAGSTSLYDAMAQGLEELAREESPLRLELVFTDGMENDSAWHCHASVRELSRELGAPVYVIGMGDIDVPAMFTMTNETHGCFAYAPNNEDIDTLYQVVAEVLSETYVLTWPAETDFVAPAIEVRVTTEFGIVEDVFVP